MVAVAKASAAALSKVAKPNGDWIEVHPRAKKPQNGSILVFFGFWAKHWHMVKCF